MNWPNYKKVLDRITEHPEEWNQRSYSRGKSCCFIGHAEMLQGAEMSVGPGWEDVMRFLGCNPGELVYLWGPSRTLEDFKRFYDDREKTHE